MSEELDELAVKAAEQESFFRAAQVKAAGLTNRLASVRDEIIKEFKYPGRDLQRLTDNLDDAIMRIPTTCYAEIMIEKHHKDQEAAVAKQSLSIRKPGLILPTEN